MKEILADVEYVHIYGFSFSEIDEDYVDWIYKNVPINSEWEVSWFTDTDKKRIENFLMNHKWLKDRLRTIKLDDINKN